MPKRNDSETRNYVGSSIPKIDGDPLVLGAARYAADYHRNDMVYASTAYSGLASAKICRLNTAAARAIPGVLAVMTACDLPIQQQIWQGQPILASDHIRYEGDAVSIVAAESLQTARRAARLITGEYQALPAIGGVAAAQAGDLHFYQENEHNRIPNSDWKVRKHLDDVAPAEVVIEETYTTHFVEHMYIEPEAVVVIPEEDTFVVYASAQSPFMTQDAVSCATGFTMNRVHVRQIYVGGSFGGKNEGVSILAARAALLAQKLGRPVCMIWTRWESMVCSAKRHPMTLNYRLSVSKNGSLSAICADIKSEGGAYSTMTPYVNWRGAVHACGCYNVPQAEVDICGYYTNRCMSGAFRGFSSPQIIFAQESIMDQMALRLGMDPIEFRKKNVLKCGDVTATNQRLTGPMAIVEMLAQAEGKTGFSAKHKAFQAQSGQRYKKGIGVAVSYRGCGYGAETADATGVFVLMHKDGTVTVRSGLVDVGQGLQTVFCQILAETMGLRLTDVRFENIQTTLLPDGNFTSASRGTFRGGRAVQEAGKILRERLLVYAARKMNKDKVELTLEDGKICVINTDETMEMKELATQGYYDGIDLGCWHWLPGEGVFWDHHAGSGDAYLAFSCSVVVTELEVDTCLGDTRLLRVYACHDSGRIINPALAKSQVTGGISMGLGMALTEQVQFRQGLVQNASFHDYILPTALDMPEMEIEFWETQDENGPFQAKSLGEASSEAVAASIANALSNALDTRFYALPITREDIVSAV